MQSDCASPEETKRPSAGQAAADKARKALKAAAEAREAEPAPPPRRSRLRRALYAAFAALILASVLFLLLADWDALRGPIGVLPGGPR